MPILIGGTELIDGHLKIGSKITSRVYIGRNRIWPQSLLIFDFTAGLPPGVTSKNGVLVADGLTPLYPATIRIRGRTAPGVEPGRDQFFTAFTGDGGNTLIEIYRQYTNRKLVIQYGAAQYDLGVVADATDFDITQSLANAPQIDRAYFGTDALGANHWNGTIHTVELS
jgi:hypothetical protein